MIRRAGARVLACAVAVAVALVATGSPAAAAALATKILTPDGADTYTITSAAGTVTMVAPPTNTGGNLREVFWPAGAPDRADSTACATWTTAAPNPDQVQQGLAFRVGPVRAVTLTKNVIFGVVWVFNVHEWDLSSTEPFVQVAQFDLVNAVVPVGGVIRPLPWRVCARLIGNTITMKIWFPPETEPAWTDPDRVRSATIPAGWEAPGKTGWYVGHLPPGGSATYTRLSVTTG
jgi:hypothetical protein